MAEAAAVASWNSLPVAEAEAKLMQCCQCQLWAAQVVARRPFGSLQDFVAAAREVWWKETPITGWLEAFKGHPRVGDVSDLQKRFARSHALSEGEQAATMASADAAVLHSLKEWNDKYEARYGHVFLICASGKSAAQVLAALKSRYGLPPHTEIQNAAAEQMAITELRLRTVLGVAATAPSSKMESEAVRRVGNIASHLQATPPARSPITAHVLDTALGRPAKGMRVQLHGLAGDGSHSNAASGPWAALGEDITNEDGRVSQLLPPGAPLSRGVYRLTFHTGQYQHSVKASSGDGNGSAGFFPVVPVVFNVQGIPGEHYHVPLLLAPFSVSTYRGS